MMPLRWMKDIEMDELMLKYFVLKPKGDSIHAKASRVAMHAYARTIKDTHPELSKQLVDWAAAEGAEAVFTIGEAD